MWKDYSAAFIKNNRASSISIMAAVFICALCLSYLCGFFYNIWTSEIEGIIQEEGGWQGRIIGDIDADDIKMIRNFANVESAQLNEEASGEQGAAVDIYFYNMRTIFEDMPLIAEKLGLKEEAASYNLKLLSRYLIHDPQDREPPLLIAFCLVVFLMVSLSLVLIIHNSFAVSMSSRVRQLGIFSSVGATPRQILSCLMQEAAVLCGAPILLGGVLGIALSYGLHQWMIKIAVGIPEAHISDFQYHPAVFAAAILSSGLTVLFSAWLPAWKLSRLTPLEAIRNSDGLGLKKKKRCRVLMLLFGIEGELAGNAMRARKKALRTSTLSLTLSFLGFTMMLCFFTLSGISTRYTYFEKYQDVWDVMITVKDTKIEDFGLTERLQGLEGVRDCAVYQKAWTVSPVPEERQSEELAGLGGLGKLTNAAVSDGGAFSVNAPVVILDDAAFEAYCRQIGVTPRFNGAIVLNQIWDSLNSNFRYRKNIPFIKETEAKTVLHGPGQKERAVEIPVIAYTQEIPVLREEYEDYALTHFIPVSMWNQISGKLGEAPTDMFIRVLGREGISLSQAEALQERILKTMGPEYETESENRIGEKITNDYIISCYMLILGGFCVLLAIIGIANVFSNTLGFLTQRKREFARYMSVGVASAGIKKMFCIEALVIAGRPLLITLPCTAAFVAFMVKASHLEPKEFLAEAPIVPIAAFCLAVFGFVALAYYIGGKRLLRCNLCEALKDDTMV